MDIEKAKQALDTLYIAAGQASLSRPQHEAVTTAAKDLLEQIEGCANDEGSTPVDVIPPKKDK